MSIRAFVLAVAAAAAAALAGCNDATAPEPVRLEDVLDDAAAIESYSALGGMVAGAPQLPSAGAGADACTYAASSQSFVCPPVTHGGLTMTRSFQLLDGSNTPQSAFDPATTAAVRTIMDMTGTGGADPFTADILYHSEQTIGGLLTQTRSIEGESSTRMIYTSSTGTDTLNTATTTDLTLPRSTSATQRVYPSGTIATEASGSALGGTQMTMTTTFNGTSTATIAVNFGGFSRTCTVNLEQPSQPPSCS